MSQKVLQRAALISRCEKRKLALAHANRRRLSRRRLPEAVHERIVQLARGAYVGSNDHHLCEKLAECEGLSLSCETLRRLLRQQVWVLPESARLPRIAGAQMQICRALDGRVSLYYGHTRLLHSALPEG